MDNDDFPVGRPLTRREILSMLGGAGVAVLAGCGGGGGSSTLTASSATSTGIINTGVTSATCAAKPALTEGPYFVDERLNRFDIRSDPTTGLTRAGTPLQLTFKVTSITNACASLVGAMVDVWHCDAAGRYSDIGSEGTAGQKFLRGYQLTDTTGLAQFTTIYPGWYQGRAVHIHFKIRVTVGGRNYEFTSQLFFNDNFTDNVYTQQPYAARGARTTRNAADGIYSGGGSALVLAPTASGSGYAATFDIGLQLS